MNRTEPQSYQEFESLLPRVGGVLRAPRAVFTRVIAHPRWLDVLALTFLVTLTSGLALSLTEVGRLALIDQWERTALAFGRVVSDEEYARLAELSANAPAYAVATATLGGPVLAFGVAAAIYAAFTGLMGGSGTYRQALAVAAHAGAVLAFRELIVTPLNYARETMASPARMTIFVPMLDAASPAARFIGAIDLFVVWWAVVLGIGVALLYQRRPGPTALAFVGIYVGLAALLAIVMVVSGGTV